MPFEITEFKNLHARVLEFPYKGFTVSLSQDDSEDEESKTVAAFKGDTFLVSDTVEELLNKVDNYNSSN